MREEMKNDVTLENELFECEVVDVAFTYGEPRRKGFANSTTEEE